MSVCPICRDDSKIMQRCLYCSSILVEGKDYEITHSGRPKMIVKKLILDKPLKNHARFMIK